MDKEIVKNIVSKAIELGNTPSAMCRAAVYLTLAELAETKNQAVLCEEMAKRVNNPPAISEKP